MAVLTPTSLTLDGDSEPVLIESDTAGIWTSDVGALYTNSAGTSLYNGTSSLTSIYFTPFNRTVTGTVNWETQEIPVEITGVMPNMPNYPLEWEGDKLGVIPSVARSGRRRGRIIADTEYVRNYKMIFDGRKPADGLELEEFYANHHPDKVFKFTNLWYDIEGYFVFDAKLKAKANSRQRGLFEVALAQVPAP